MNYPEQVSSPHKLAAKYDLTIDAYTLHGDKVTTANMQWKKSVTITDPCHTAAYTATAPSTQSYTIGAATKDIMVATSQFKATSQSDFKYCEARITATYTFGGVNDAKWFDTTSQTLKFKQTSSVTKNTKFTVTATFKLDKTVAL